MAMARLEPLNLWTSYVPNPLHASVFRVQIRGERAQREVGTGDAAGT